MYVDGLPFNKSIDYAFDDESSKFGSGPCLMLKKGIKYLPRDTECSVKMQIVCKWNGKYCLLKVKILIMGIEMRAIRKGAVKTELFVKIKNVIMKI